jgi:hypothetical protein
MSARLLLPLALIAALIVPATASAAVTVGISENNPGMFTDPLFTPLKVRTVRVVVSYNVMTNATDDGAGDELARVSDYLARAQAAGIEPLVTFEHARGDWTVCRQDRSAHWTVCRQDRSAPQCHLPTKTEFENNFKLFRAAFPWVRTYAPWNEANHPSQPTETKPKVAAQYTNIAARNCAGCTIVVMDVLDAADRGTSTTKRPKYTKVTKYVKTLRKALKVPARICGLHNYSDTNRFRSHGTKALVKAMGCKQIWLTETGGLFHFESFWSSRTMDGCRSAEACQLKATKYMFKLTKANRKIKRLYVYTWFGGVTERFDAGLVAHGRARPAYAEVAKRLG